MKKAIGSLLLIGFLASTLPSCLIRTRDRHHHHSARKRAKCSPGHHWENGRCVHNGRKHGHDKRRR